MKKKLNLQLLIILLFIITQITACVPDQSEYNYIFDYWCRDWYGWYEITNATGKYANLNSMAESCLVQSDYTVQLEYYMDVMNTEGELQFSFLGDYGHEEGKEYGQVSLCEFYLPAFPDDRHVPAAFEIDGEDHGIDQLAVFKGSVGAGNDTMEIEIFLRPWGTTWEDLEDYGGDVFGDRSYEESLPPDYEQYLEVLNRETILREEADRFWCDTWYGYYEISNTTGDLVEYELEKAECFVVIYPSNLMEDRFSCRYRLTVNPTEEKDGKKIGKELYLRGTFEPGETGESGSILIDRWNNWEAEGSAKLRDQDGTAVIEITVHAEKETGSMDITAYLGPEGVTLND